MDPELADEEPRERTAHLVAEAVGSLATRTSFLVVAWLLLSGPLSLAEAALVVVAQVAAYVALSPVGVWLVRRIRPARVSVAGDLASAAAVSVIAFVHTDPVWFGVGIAGVAALRAISDRAKNAYRHREPAVIADPTPIRKLLARLIFAAFGIAVGVGAAWFGPTGALWFLAVAFTAAAAATVWDATDGGKPAADHSSGETLAQLVRDRLVQRLGVVLLLTNVIAQGAGVILVGVWLRDVLPPESVGYVAGAFMLGTLCGGLLLANLVRHPSMVLALCLGFLAGGGAIMVRGGMAPVLLLIVGVALIAGVAFASVTPAMGRMLSQRVPAALRARTGGIAATAAYIGTPAGTLAAMWLLPKLDLPRAVAVGGGLLIVAMLVPVFTFRSWELLNTAVPSVVRMLGAAKLPARLTITLAYANGEWLIEVRKGRALLGARHLVKSSEAMSMLSMLDVPAVSAKVEQALAIDQVEASRQVERMRSELAEMEAKLSGLTEMVEITDSRKETDTSTGPVSAT